MMPQTCPFDGHAQKMKVVITVHMKTPGTSVTRDFAPRPSRRSHTVAVISMVAERSWFIQAK